MNSSVARVTKEQKDRLEFYWPEKKQYYCLDKYPRTMKLSLNHNLLNAARQIWQEVCFKYDIDQG